MEGRHLRLLCLDGGGTRGISTIYVLREIMDRLEPGHGGNVRPCEYFDIIGASGPNALCALLFVRFGLTVQECIEFYRGFSNRMDRVEDVLMARAGEELDDDDWEDFRRVRDPAKPLETIRQRVTGLAFRDMVVKHVSDWFARAKETEDGEFDYKAPSADVGVGRCRAAVMGSEAPGYGDMDAVNPNRRYHVPIWHRTYRGRHVQQTYTFWAIGLGTMGSPDIVRSGVRFPDFSATGAHSVHNPTLLLLEECYKIWPGMKPGVLISIGTGGMEDVSKIDTWNSSYPSRPLTLRAAQACAALAKTNADVADEIERNVLPFDESLRNAYFRLDLPEKLPFFEGEAARTIAEMVTEWVQQPEVATKTAHVAARLSVVCFPDTMEDLVALSSLSTLLLAFTAEGYAKEAELLSDAMSSFVRYESAFLGRRSRDKLMMAVSANHMAHSVFHKLPHDVSADLSDRGGDGILTEGRKLMVSLVIGTDPGWHRRVGLADLPRMADACAAAYFLVVTARRSLRQEIESNLVQSLLKAMSQLSREVDLELNPRSVARIHDLLRLTSLGAICEAATSEALRYEPRFILNGAFVRYLHEILATTDLSNVASRVLAPLSLALSTHIHLGQWSTFRDSTVASLLLATAPVPGDVSCWGLANLAAERAYLSGCTEPGGDKDLEVLDACQGVLQKLNQAFADQRDRVAGLSVEKGYFGLLRKVFVGHSLDFATKDVKHKPTVAAKKLFASSRNGRTGENLLHMAVRSGFINIVKMVVEFSGKDDSGELIGCLNKEGLPPFHMCVTRRTHLDCLILCRLGGARIDQQDCFGRSALHYCFPTPSEFPDYYPVFNTFIRASGLPLTLPNAPLRSWGSEFIRDLELDTRTFVLRAFVRYLYCRGADICLQDSSGSAPGHLAVRNGWGINTDLFFGSSSEADERKVREYLKLRDDDGNTALGLARANHDFHSQKLLLTEMRKRCLDIPSLSPQTPYCSLTPQVNLASSSPSSSERGQQAPARYATSHNTLAPAQTSPAVVPIVPAVSNDRMTTYASYCSNPSPRPGSESSTSTPPASMERPAAAQISRPRYPGTAKIVEISGPNRPQPSLHPNTQRVPVSSQPSQRQAGSPVPPPWPPHEAPFPPPNIQRQQELAAPYTSDQRQPRPLQLPSHQHSHMYQHLEPAPGPQMPSDRPTYYQSQPQAPVTLVQEGEEGRPKSFLRKLIRRDKH